jgi:hypothetical protein
MLLVAPLLAIASLAISAAPAVARTSHDGSLSDAVFNSRVFATGNDITHRIPGGRATISQPDDITSMDGRIYVGFQNEVGPQGQPTASGNARSTVVAFDLAGRPVAKWSVKGKCDGLTADPQLHRVIATVNEDANSSVYLINPHGGKSHYQYSEALRHNGGTDAISIYRGMVLISASAPGTTGTESAPQPTFPAADAHGEHHPAFLRRGPRHGGEHERSKLRPDGEPGVDGS